MFPKSHAAAYMMGTLRLGWCKVHRPVEYYATYFTVKPEGFDASIVAGGMKAVRKRIVELENSEDTNKKDADTLVCLQVVREMYALRLRLSAGRYLQVARVSVYSRGREGSVCPSPRWSVWARRPRRTSMTPSAPAAPPHLRNSRPRRLADKERRRDSPQQ